ncbi:MAG: phenylalanine--tRNA ligase subunit alpha [Oscillospiraceae bacterium]|nr:phenylalanine--tRNA ligase subunit alpha [Oscillospiraceae bacterium]
MITQLEQIREKAIERVRSAANLQELEQLRIKYLGKKGELTALLKNMGKLSAEERPVVGQLANSIREKLDSAMKDRTEALSREAMDLRLQEEALDVTIPGKTTELGKKHPMSIVLDETKEIFIGMGFEIAEGPEIETEYYNFTALNTKPGHPARDWQDTFYLREDSSVLLRTQTSPVQVRVMEKKKPPIRIISPGRVYRKDEVDATHSPMFHQIEGLVVDKGITMTDLKGTLVQFVGKLYGPDAKLRFRPHHFPFTEPSCEIDIMCFECRGEGCRVCKGEGWIELLGAGMVHPRVLEGCGIDTDIYSGFAFGIGVERLTMRRFSVSDMRLFFENDIRFLSQF